MKKIVTLTILIHVAVFLRGQKVDVYIDTDAAYFLEENDSILKYQIGYKSINGTYRRTNYIHPLYTLDGRVMTEDFPDDHLHHRGLFWAWHQLYIGDESLGDSWKIENFIWDIQSVVQIEKKKGAKSIRTEVFWKSPLWVDGNGIEKPMVKELTTITVYPLKNNNRKIDIEIAILALEPRMRIGGSEDKKGYGGFSQRVKLVDDMVFTGPKGILKPINLPISGEGWLDISGSYNKKDNISGLTIFSHPKNPGFPNPWIIRNSRSMQNAVYPFPGAKGVVLSTQQPTILRYRLLVHDGPVKMKITGRMYKQYKKYGLRD